MKKGLAPHESLRRFAAGLLLASLGRGASAQSADVAGLRIVASHRVETPAAYGTTAPTMVSIAAADCAPVFGTSATVGGDGYVYPTAGALFDCPLDLPEGARPFRVDALTHDESDAGSLTVVLAYCPTQPPGPGCFGAFAGSSLGTAAAPFQGNVSSDLSTTGYVIDKTSNLYLVRIDVSSNAGDVKFRQVDVSYRLQVSTPAPGTQTFGDVPPSNPYYKGIEALAASGITGGCGNGNFCPSQNVTRGEIATFFARALGLNFPN